MAEAANEQHVKRAWWDLPLLAAELAILAAIFAVDRPGIHIIFLSKTLYLAVLAAISFQVRHCWKSVGWRVRGHWMRWVAIGLGGGLAMEALELFFTQPLLGQLLNLHPDLSDFAEIRGNYRLLAPALVFAWTLAAFGEEFVYRGYLLNRLSGLFESMTNARVGSGAALIVSSVIFGFAHLFQGTAGVIENIVDGLILGALYLGSGRRLLVPFLAHGVQDSTDFLLICFGLYPGM